ncbi:hypothetical protein GP486_003929 [Trichoglossum hirsutum]|uniref:Uncharacterized protein n=1 Tax=Trichoglossum hirsutum TaxID=265104 RepID=A0A9P8LBR6_9PEZI|nr:hypothetical protein GP486_003929 [Trichoglossum hirsutum]
MAETAKRTAGPKPEPQAARAPARKPARYYSESESDYSEEEQQQQQQQPARRKPQRAGGKGDLVPLGGLDSVTDTAKGLTQSAGETLRGVTGSALTNEKKGGDKSDTLRLRLDLNLDIEITLKARIHGDLELALLYGSDIFLPQTSTCGSLFPLYLLPFNTPLSTL